MQEQVRVNGILTTTNDFGYDKNGSLITRTSTDGSSADYGYDLRGRLAGATVRRLESGVLIVETGAYIYDANGIRARETTTKTVGVGTPTSEIRLLVVDKMNPTGYAQVLEERTAGGLLLATMIHGMEQISQLRDGQVSYYLTDGHSGVRQLLNAVGAVLAAYRYDAFGGMAAQVGTISNPLLYRSERFDAVLGQYYLRARMYDPARGRFGSMDSFDGSAQEPSSLHKYMYANADGLNKYDPTGMWTASGISVSIGLTASLGGLTGGLLGGIDSALGGESFASGFLKGAAAGIVVGGIGGLVMPLLSGHAAWLAWGARIGIGVNITGTAIASIDAYVRGNKGQLAFRLALGMFGLGAFRWIANRTGITGLLGGMLESSNPVATATFAFRGPQQVWTDLQRMLVRSPLGRQALQWMAGNLSRLPIVDTVQRGGAGGAWDPVTRMLFILSQNAVSYRGMARTFIHEMLHAIGIRQTKLSEILVDVFALLGHRGASEAFWGPATRRIAEVAMIGEYAQLPFFFYGETGLLLLGMILQEET
jgi:RHS repeat-associated protein